MVSQPRITTGGYAPALPDESDRAHNKIMLVVIHTILFFQFIGRD
jgi:hypothetical protein